MIKMATHHDKHARRPPFGGSSAVVAHACLDRPLGQSGADGPLFDAACPLLIPFTGPAKVNIRIVVAMVHAL